MKLFENFMNVMSAKSDAMELIKYPFETPGITEVENGLSNTYHESYENKAPALFGNENNERLTSLKSTLSYSEKTTVAGVAAAGDWVIDLMTCGIKKFLCVDINKFQAYIIVLKIRALQTLTFEEFDSFMIDTKSKGCMSFDTIKRILEQYDDIPSKACLVFWKTLFEHSNYKSETVRRNYIAFENLYLNHGSTRILGGVYVKNSSEYEKARQTIKTSDAELYFEIGSIFDTDTIVQYAEMWNTKFKLIYLSNIHNFSTSESYIAELKHIWRNCIMKSGIAIAYVIQLPSNILTTTGNAVNVRYINASATSYLLTTTVSLIRAMKKSGFNLQFTDVKTCRGYGSIINEDSDCVVTIKKY